MHPRGAHETSLRAGRPEFSRLAWALGLSIAVHLLCFGGYHLGNKLNLWQSLRLPKWLQRLTLATVPPPQPTSTQQELPLIFVDVNPQAATPDAPENTPFYSSQNSRAANPDADQETGAPRITGEQTQMVRTEDTQRSPFDRLQPTPPPPATEQPAEQPKPAEAPGDLAMARPEVKLRPETPPQTRPRTIKEALMRQNRNTLVGQKMKQEGGVKRRLEFSSLDAKASSFGAYDQAFIEAVQSRWYDLLDNMSYDGYRRGRVVLQFHLTHDGRIVDLKVIDNSVGETLGLLCQKAVLDPAPFEKWPREMRLLVDKDYREIQFAFYYN